MTKLIIKSKNFDLTPSLKDYITGKFSRFEKYEKHLNEIIIELYVERNPRIAENKVVEVNMFAPGSTIRAGEASPDMYASVDMVIDKLERQMEKYEDLRFRNKKSKFRSKESMYPDLESEVSFY